MSRFQDHFKAEIFAETFSKLFFSGPWGRSVAFFFVLAYGALKIVLLPLRLAIVLLFASIRFGYACWHESRSRKQKRVFDELRRNAKAFGDEFRNVSERKWRVARISGNGRRIGRFRLELSVRADTEEIRVVFESGTDAEREISTREILSVLNRETPFPDARDFPDFYRNARRHFL